MHHRFMPKNHSQLGPGQLRQYWHGLWNGRSKSGPFRVTSIRGLRHQSQRMGPHPVARLFKTGDRLTRTASQTQIVTDPADQRVFQHDRKIRGHQNRSARRAGDSPDQFPAFRTRTPASRRTGATCLRHPAMAFYHIPVRTQPYSPAWQLPGQVRDQRAVRADDKSEHMLFRQAFACHHAAAQRPCFRLFVFRVNQWFRVMVIRVSRGWSPLRPWAQRRPQTNGPARP